MAEMQRGGGARLHASETLKRYLQEIARIPGIDADTEKVLGRRAQQGEREAMVQLVEANLRFVVSFAKRYRGCGMSFLDLINEGNIGLMEAAKRYDPAKDVRFLTYAVWWVRQAIVHAISEQGGAVRLPQKQANLVHRLARVQRALQMQFQREPTTEEVADEMGTTVPDVERLMLVGGDQVSLERSSEEDPDAQAMIDRLEQDTMPGAEDVVFRAALESQIRACIDDLDPKEELVLRLRFGLDDRDPLTLKEIGDQLNLSRERIRQIEAQALAKLKRMQSCQRLRAYLN